MFGRSLIQRSLGVGCRRKVLPVHPLFLQQRLRQSAITPSVRCFHSMSRLLSEKPLKDQMISQGRNIVQRIYYRLKWVLLRQNRPFNIDEISTFISWVLMGHFAWIAIGTTTFFGLIFYFLNSILDNSDGLKNNRLAQSLLKRLISFDTNLNITFNDETFKSSWKDGMICLQDLKVTASLPSATFDLTLDTLKLNLSFRKWSEGRGLIHDVELIGLRGDVSRASGVSAETVEDQIMSSNYEFKSVKISDSYLNIQSDNPAKKVKFQLFNAELSRLRMRWLAYDFFSAESCTGAIDGSLFTIHKRQENFAHFTGLEPAEEETKSPWKKISRLRIDQLDMSNIDSQSHLNWIQKGKVEVIADIMLPNEEAEAPQAEASLWNDISAAITSIWEEQPEYDSNTNNNKYVVFDVKVQFSDLRAGYPLSVPASGVTGLPLVSVDDLRSLVTFINDRSLGQVIEEIDHSDVNPFDSSEIELPGSADSITLPDMQPQHSMRQSFPPIKFKLVKNLNSFELFDPICLIKMKHSSHAGHRGTDDFVDSLMQEIFGQMLLFKDETQSRLIQNYSKRSNMEILFSNLIFGNLILVGLGAFMI